MALDPQLRSHQSCLEELRSRLNRACKSVPPIGLWSQESADEAFGEPGQFAAIYIDGGNAYRLLYALRQYDLIGSLRHFVFNGGGVYGDSAGAAFLGADIDSVAKFDPNEVGLSDTRAANMINDCAIFVHYDKPLADPRAWARKNRRPALALADDTGVLVRGDRICVVGESPAWLFTSRQRTLLRPYIPFQIGKIFDEL